MTGGSSRLLVRLKTELTKKLRGQHSVEELSTALAGRELHFQAPPLTPGLVEAIRRITPQFHLKPNEESRRVWELSQNGSCWGEYDALAPLLESMPLPGRVLDVGPGMGRSTVFFKRKLGWEEVPFHLYEGDGEIGRYPIMAERSASSFCGDLDWLRRVLGHNGVGSWEIFDAGDHGGRLDGLPGPYDLIYSFYGVGFHWALPDFWDEILQLMGDDSVAVFTVHQRFEEFPALQEMAFRYLPLHRILAKDRPLRLLVLSPNPHRLRSLGAKPAGAA